MNMKRFTALTALLAFTVTTPSPSSHFAVHNVTGPTPTRRLPTDYRLFVTACRSTRRRVGEVKPGNVPSARYSLLTTAAP